MKQHSKREGREAGFTLMEMLVVLVLIGLIAAVAVPQVMRMFEGAKTKAAKIQLQTVGQALSFYQIDNGAYPDRRQGIGALWEAPEGIDSWAGPYVRRPEQLTDPWGRPLLYSPLEGRAGFELVSLGADGTEGGRGEDADQRFRP
jgi:general secretion pathway protein G